MFDDWCEIRERERGRKQLCGLRERPDGRRAVREEFIDRVRSHYDKLERIADDVERLGFPGASAILKERMPRTRRARSGEIGEIIATEFVEHHTDFRVPVRRLRYKDGREMALRGDDFLGVDEDARGRLLLLKGESKSRVAMSRAVVILPWIAIPNLGSHILSLVRRQLPDDWTERYNTTPVLIETFVETPRFTGALYKASGWTHVGTTQGRGRYDRHTRRDQPRKDVWLRPLRKDWRRTLNR